MIIVNKPDSLIDIQCYRCKAIIPVHPMTNLNSPWITNCGMHESFLASSDHENNKNKQGNCRHGINDNSCDNCRCQHEPSDMFLSNAPDLFKCIKCGEFYR